MAVADQVLEGWLATESREREHEGMLERMAP